MEAEVSKKRTRWTWPIIIGTLVFGFLAYQIVTRLVFSFEFYFGVWHTWLGYIGLLSGLVAAANFNWPALRSAIAGFAAGVVLLTIINAVIPTPAPCLQNAKGWDILRAYSINCGPAR
jgi:hypothetical protein